MGKLGDRELIIERGDGAWVWDCAGKRYLDASASLWYCNAGHGRQALADAAREQMALLAGYHTFDAMANPPAIALAERIRELAPLGPDSAVFFTSGGSDSVDTAAKIARRYWVAKRQAQRQIIISRQGGYHGVNAFGTSLAGIEANATGWGPLVSRVLQVPRDDLDALERLIREHSGQIAAFIGEPVQGAAGVYPPNPGYWQGVQDLLRDEEILLIADEVVTGFGRLGEWFASSRYEIEPDLVTCAKGLSSGYLPIGAVLAAPRLLDVLWSPDAGSFRHGYTYSGHPVACAVALANLDVIEREGLVQRVKDLEPLLRWKLGALAEHDLVGEVRVAGLLCGVELDVAAREAEPTLVEQVVAGARQRGVLVRNLLGAALQISPPFVIGEPEVEFLSQALLETLDAVQAA
jgi:adenosylmethionine-8-amino-7-oxononanoate aminotransferase